MRVGQVVSIQVVRGAQSAYMYKALN